MEHETPKNNDQSQGILPILGVDKFQSIQAETQGEKSAIMVRMDNLSPQLTDIITVSDAVSNGFIKL